MGCRYRPIKLLEAGAASSAAISTQRSAAPEFATREREKTRSRPFAPRTAPKPKHGQSKWRRSAGGRSRPRRSANASMAARLDGSQMPSVRNQRQYTARCDPSPAGYVDLETRRVVALPFLRNETLQATGTHNQVDRGAGNHALSLGSSGRRPLGIDASGSGVRIAFEHGR
jgi:hypothetical protein